MGNCGAGQDKASGTAGVCARKKDNKEEEHERRDLDGTVLEHGRVFKYGEGRQMHSLRTEV